MTPGHAFDAPAADLVSFRPAPRADLAASDDGGSAPDAGAPAPVTETVAEPGSGPTPAPGAEPSAPGPG